MEKTIYDEVKQEREHQIQKWGITPDDTLNTPNDWISYIARYATTWFTGVFPPYPGQTVDSFRTSMIKVAAIAIAAVESIDRQRNATGKTFYED